MMNEQSPNRRPLLIVIGGFAGTGKSAMSHRLSRNLAIPRLGSDTIGRTVKGWAELRDLDVNAHSVAYQVLFRLCEEFIQSGVSVVLEMTLGWPQQWSNLDRIVRDNPTTVFLPIILRCPHDLCMNRIAKRHQAKPDYYSSPEAYAADPRNPGIWRLLEELDRPEVRLIDASGTEAEVYDQIRVHVGKYTNRSTIKSSNATSKSAPIAASEVVQD
jgi:predicted kinase